MVRNARFILLAAGAAVLTPAMAAAQQSEPPQRSQQQSRVGAIISALFGDRIGASASIEQQWAAGRTPLATQQQQFEARIDAEVRSRALTSANGDRMKAEYDELVQLEARYGADGRFTTQERTDLGDRYGALTQALSDGSYGGGGSSDSAGGSTTLTVADGRVAFERRVDAAVAARRITRVQATALKRDYAALVQVEAGYARNGIDNREQDDLDARLDALDARVGDGGGSGGGAPVLDNRTRLTNVGNALARSGLAVPVQAQIRVELGDLTRLEAAYSRTTPSSDDRAYLERRIVDLETRARIRR